MGLALSQESIFQSTNSEDCRVWANSNQDPAGYTGVIDQQEPCQDGGIPKVDGH